MNCVDNAPTLNPWDRAGLLVSSACLLHCLAVPLLIIMLPSLSLSILENEWIHVGLAMLAIPVATKALVRGYRSHGSFLPSLFTLPGIALLYLALLLHEPHWLETAVASAGALLLASGHILNHRFICQCYKVN